MSTSHVAMMLHTSQILEILGDHIFVPVPAGCILRFSPPLLGSEKKGSFQRSPFSRDSREFGGSREPPDCRKKSGIRPHSSDSREFGDCRDSRDSSSHQKTSFAMTPFSGLPPRSIRFSWRKKQKCSHR